MTVRAIRSFAVVFVGCLAFWALVFVAAAYSADQPPLRTAFPAKQYVMHGSNGKVCFKGTRAQLRRALRSGRLTKVCK
jgi:hypothetical protein